MAKWYEGQPRLVAADLIHPSPQGARIVAKSLTGQLLIGYERYVQHHPARTARRRSAHSWPERHSSAHVAGGGKQEGVR